MRFVVTGTLKGGDEIARHHARHGDGVHKIALGVPDADFAYRHAVEHGARGVRTPHWAEDDQGGALSVATYGDTQHLFVQRDGYSGAFLPGYEPRARAPRDPDELLLMAVDHVVGNVELGHMEEWVGYYERVFGMTEMIHFDEAISTEYSALMSKVWSPTVAVDRLLINEPAEGKRKSQIDEYIDYYGGAVGPARGAGRRATSCAASRAGAAMSSSTSPSPTTTRCRGGSARSRSAWRTSERCGILVDRDDEGYLLQIFTKPLGDRPTVFFEIIERHGARGFGEGNRKALFEAIEREQERRGNL